MTTMRWVIGLGIQSEVSQMALRLEEELQVKVDDLMVQRGQRLLSFVTTHKVSLTRLVEILRGTITYASIDNRHERSVLFQGVMMVRTQGEKFELGQIMPNDKRILEFDAILSMSGML